MKICSNHPNYQVPLIYTYSWAYNEYWCPYCGCLEGMLGAGENVYETEELKKRLELYEKATDDYRHAMGVRICVSTMWKGEQTKPEDLPEEEKKRLSDLREKGWELNTKIEGINEN